MRIVIKNCQNCAKPHEWEFERPFLKETRFITRTYGMNARQFQDGLNEEGTEASDESCAALLDILHRREGIVIPQLDIDLDWDDLEIIATEQELAAAAAIEAAGKDDGTETTTPG